MALPIIELLGFALGEFIFMILFYNTGALLIRILTFGKTKFPFFGSGIGKEKPLPKPKYGFVIALSGFIFYILIISIFIIELRNITS